MGLAGALAEASRGGAARRRSAVARPAATLHRPSRKTERMGNRSARRGRSGDARHVAPRAQHDDGALEHAGQRHLGERTVETRQRDDRVARRGDEHVARVTEARR